MVDEWDEQEIYEFLKEITPSDSAYVDSKAIDHGADLEKMIPHTPESIRSVLHYPSPRVYIETGNAMKSKKAKSLDIFDHACKFAQENGGCVKFFNESRDRDYMDSDDYLILLDDSLDGLDDYQELNDRRSISLLDRDGAKEFFRDKIGGFDH